MAKTLYHGELCKMSPVQVTITSDVLESKFPGKPPYVALKIDGEERNYNTENDDCADFFEGQKGRTFTIIAEGRDADASITYVGESAAGQTARDPEPPAKKDGRRSRPPAEKPGRRSNAPPPAKESTAPPPQTTPPPPRQRAAGPPPVNGGKPPQETPEQRVLRARQHANRVANVFLIAYSAGNFARLQVRDKFGQEMSEAQFQSCVSTIAIQLEKDGFHHQMPTGIIDLGGTAKEKEKEPTSDNDGAAN